MNKAWQLFGRISRISFSAKSPLALFTGTLFGKSRPLPAQPGCKILPLSAQDDPKTSAPGMTEYNATKQPLAPSCM